MRQAFTILAIMGLCAFAAKADDGKKDPPRPAPQIETFDKLHEIIRRLLVDELDGEQLKSLETKDLKRIQGELLRLHARLSIQLGGLMSDGAFRYGPGIVFQTDPGVPMLIMSGSFTGKDGVERRYTLRGLGKGEYELNTSSSGETGHARKIKDRGTMPELQRRHAFLKDRGGFVFFGDLSSHRGSLPGFALSPFGGVSPRASKPSTSAVLELGVMVRKPAPELAFHLGLPAETGLVVESVVDGGRAAEIGLRRFDVIVSVDGEPVTEARDLKNAGKPGQKHTLQIVRRTKKRELTIGGGNDGVTSGDEANPRNNR